MRSSFPIANPTASAKPSSLILNNSSKAPPERVISFKSLACSDHEGEALEPSPNQAVSSFFHLISSS